MSLHCKRVEEIATAALLEFSAKFRASEIAGVKNPGPIRDVLLRFEDGARSAISEALEKASRKKRSQ